MCNLACGEKCGASELEEFNMLLYIPFPLGLDCIISLRLQYLRKQGIFLKVLGYIAENNKMARLDNFMEVFFLLKGILKNKYPDFQYSIEICSCKTALCWTETNHPAPRLACPLRLMDIIYAE